MVPHGFHFAPTDEELIQILDQKASGHEMSLQFILQANVYQHEPKDLEWVDDKALSKHERYYYCKREVHDSREVPGRGWWKATSHVKKVCPDQYLVGYKRPLTFHRFKGNDRNRSNAIKTNWIMHEYSLESRTTEWRLCKIKYKGKPSLQEEMEMQVIRHRQLLSNYNSNDSEAGSSTSVQLPEGSSDKQEEQSLVLQNAAMLVGNNAANNHQQSSCQFWDALSTSQTSHDGDLSLLPFSNPGYGFADEEQQQQQLQQEISSDEVFPSLWYWQN